MKTLFKRRLVLQGLAASAIGLGVGQGAFAQQALEALKKRGSIKIGVPADLPPFGLLDPDKRLVGLDVDMANLVAKSLGLKAELVPILSADRVPWLQQGKVDLVISTLGKNPEREKLIDFSDTYSNFHLVVFGAKSLKVASGADLAGMTVVVTKGSLEDAELTKVAAPTAQIIRAENNAATLATYVEKKATLIAAGIGVGAALGVRYPELETDSKFILKESPNFIGVPKGEAQLLEKVNEAIQAARASGDLRNIQKQWFSRAGLKTGS